MKLLAKLYLSLMFSISRKTILICTDEQASNHVELCKRLGLNPIAHLLRIATAQHGLYKRRVLSVQELRELGVVK